jgi:hypothetical protein
MDQHATLRTALAITHMYCLFFQPFILSPFFLAVSSPLTQPQSSGTTGTTNQVISVGATDSTDTVVDFSSRGPGANATGYNIQSPLLVAPGLDIQGPDCNDNNGYSGYSGMC